MPLNTFANGTQSDADLVNANFSGLADGSNDLSANSLAKTRRQHFANFCTTGMTFAASGSLSTNLLAGEAYVNGKLVTIVNQTVTVPGSKDSYFDLKDDGTVIGPTQVPGMAVANNATAPAMTLNSDGSRAFRLGFLVSSSSAITGVAQVGFDIGGNILLNTNPLQSILMQATLTNSAGIGQSYTTINGSSRSFYVPRPGYVKVSSRMGRITNGSGVSLETVFRYLLDGGQAVESNGPFMQNGTSTGFLFEGSIFCSAGLHTIALQGNCNQGNFTVAALFNSELIIEMV